MENPKNQIVERIKEANNVLVTVSTNPSVDQLSAAIGLTLLLNKIGKHGTAVFSGNVPSTIEFLKPEETIEKDTDSLRDFIIALDKAKADKLRYKVEDKMVKIFITPYRTSIDEKDLEFSQGDFNVDVVVGLGVKAKEDLDQAISGHGRILHDATIVTINTTEAGSVGSMNWVDNQASSLCEMVVAMADMIKTGSLDAQMATAFLTGIVAETERFSNSKTTSNTMNASAKLMTAGANQQLIATKLQEPEKPQDGSSDQSSGDNSPKTDNGGESGDGALQIDHDELPEPQPESPVDQIDIDEHGNLQAPTQSPEIETEGRKMLLEPPADDSSGMPGYEESQAPTESHLVMDPPSLGGQLTANSEPEALDPALDPLSPHMNGTILSHDSGPAQSDVAPAVDPNSDQTLSQIEESVDSPHTDESQQTATTDTPPDISQARDAVQAAATDSASGPLEPIAALNAQPVDLDLGHNDAPMLPPDKMEDPANTSKNPLEIQIDPLTGSLLNHGESPASVSNDLNPVMPPPPTQLSPLDSSGLPTNLVPPMPGLPPDPTAPSVSDPTAPPPVPPPMMPPPPLMPPMP